VRIRHGFGRRVTVTAPATHCTAGNQVIARESVAEVFSRSWRAGIPRTSA